MRRAQALVPRTTPPVLALSDVGRYPVRRTSADAVRSVGCIRSAKWAWAAALRGRGHSPRRCAGEAMLIRPNSPESLPLLLSSLSDPNTSLRLCTGSHAAASSHCTHTVHRLSADTPVAG